MIFIFTEYGKEQGKEKNVACPYLTAGGVKDRRNSKVGFFLGAAV